MHIVHTLRYAFVNKTAYYNIRLSKIDNRITFSCLLDNNQDLRYKQNQKGQEETMI